MCTALWLLTGSAAGQDPPPQPSSAQEILRSYVEAIRQFNALQVRDAPVASVIVLPAFYEQRSFLPAWTSRQAVDDLLRAVQDIEQDGLSPQDYHLDALQRLRAEVDASPAPSPQLLADFDLLLTDALVRLSYHILFGKVDPESLDADWNLTRELGEMDPVASIQEALDASDVYARIEALKPAQPYYTRLKAALATYRAYQAGGGWPQVPGGPALELGMKDDRLPLLRRRLAAEGDLAETAASDTALTFNPEVDAAVRRFQRRYGLAADGVVGPGTLHAMNVPVEARIDQLRINLERGRWVLRDLADTYVLVNIAGFRVYLVKDGQPAWSGRVVVGRPYHKTPVFREDMRYLVINPTWTIPRSITVNETLPAVKRDPGYLRARNISVVDGSGRVIDQGTIDWSSYTGQTFPYVLRQEPGPNNALGQIKFMFPNPHAVYLHDTPSRSLFDRTTRTFSHGCIRVEHPLELAEQVLDDPEEWSMDHLRRAVASGKLQTVYLEKPIPVLLLYWTAEVQPDGAAHFMPDIYDRDAAVLRGLQGTFKFRARPILGSKRP